MMLGDAVAYTAQIMALLPPGRLWSDLSQHACVFYSLVRGLALEFERLHTRIAALPVELDPRTSAELLSEWETFVGLPDCTDTPESAAERQAAVHARLVASGSQSRENLEAVAAALGVTITLRYYHPRRSGDPYNEYYAGQGWQWVCDVVAPAGTPAATRTQLECQLKRMERAHVLFRFFYE